MSFLGEIKRRKVFRVAAVYAVVAWLIVQIVGAINEPLNLPEWFDTVIIIALAAGFPIAVILAWVFEFTSQGLKPSASPSTGSVPAQSTAQRFGYISQVLILLAVGFLVVDQYFLGSRGGEPQVAGSGALPDRQVQPVTRFRITPPASAPLANMGGYDVRISHDGTKIIYYGQSPQTGEVSLYLHELDGFDARRIPGSEVAQPQGGLNAFFSPDDSWIGFQVPGQGVMRASVSGGEPLRILEPLIQFLGGTWTSDDFLIYSAGDGLFRVPAMGPGEPERLTPEPTEDDNDVYIGPVLLPGEQKVLFSLFTPDEDERLAVLDLETRQITILLEGSVQNPTYASTGHIIYGRDTTLEAISFNPDTLATGMPFIVKQGVRKLGAFSALDYGLSKTGTIVYVPLDDENLSLRELVWVDRDGEVIDRAVAEPIEGARDPRLSPDGQRLALTAGAANTGSIWIYDLSGRPGNPLVTEGGSRSPIWSSDGDEIAFNSFRDTYNDVYRIASDGGNRAAIPLSTNRLAAWPAVWSERDEIILDRTAGAAPGTNQDIVAVELGEIVELRELVATNDREFDASLSPNGEWLAYVSDRTGIDEIWIRRYPDGIPSRVSEGGGAEPRWSHDGAELFYLQGSSILAVTTETDPEFSPGTPAELFTGEFWLDTTLAARSYDVAGDGNFLMIRQLTASPNQETLRSMVVVQNWFEELRRLAPGE